MRSGRGRGAVSVLTALALLLVAGLGSPRLLLASEEEGTPAVTYAQYLEIKPGELKGQVLYPDGKTFAAQVAVRVWSPSQKKFIYQATADKKGKYALPTLEPGHYLAIFGDRVTVDLRTVKDGTFAAKSLNVFIPHGRAFFAPREMETVLAGAEEGGEEPGRDKLLSSLVISGRDGTVTAVGTVSSVEGASASSSNSEGDDESEHDQGQHKGEEHGKKTRTRTRKRPHWPHVSP